MFDATNYEKQVATTLPVLLAQALKLLEPYQQIQRKAVKDKQENPQVKIGKKDRFLQPFKGDPVPPLLKLKNLDNKIIDLSDMNGQVVLVNFWASWCPPCVHEMPSMQRLQNMFKNKPFTILGVNMAEDKETINTFLKTKVSVDFPVLLDSDGTALKRWGVFAFPTSYVVDKKGHIRYALFGGLEWDTPDIIQKISSLLDE
ncbi:MAG: TlpA disulfide reductase family protein [Gammaproteobacteria bacterium]